VVLLVDEGSNPFEMGVATELFGLRRPELDRPWYDFTVCAARPRIRMHLGMFTMTGVAGLAAAELADTLIVPNRPIRTSRPARRSSRRSGGAPGW
jgi:AraC family transcriptional regulator, transcriptional activator FtrA